MVQDFLELADKTYEDPLDDPWIFVTHSNEPKLDVYRLEGSDNCFKVVAELSNTQQVAFDILADIEVRSTWDDLCEEGKVLEQVDGTTRIQYIKTKAIWPTSARDSVVLGYVNKMSDGRYLNVARSIDYEQCPEKTGIVRMEAKIAGQIVSPTIGKPGYCRVVQVANGDLKGWVPASVLSFIATKAIPMAFKQLDSVLQKKPQLTESEMIKAAESCATQTISAETKQSDQKHVQKLNRKPKIAGWGKAIVLLHKYQPYMILYIFLRLIFKDLHRFLPSRK